MRTTLFALLVGVYWLGTAPASAQRRPRSAPEPKPDAAAPVPQGTPSDPMPALVPSEPPAAEAVPSPPPAPPAEAEASAPAAEAEANAAPATDTESVALKQELASVMDHLVQLRSRTRVLGRALFKTKVRIFVENEAAPDQVAARFAIWLDGAPVFQGDGSALRDPERVLFEGFAAPGPHVLTYEVEQRARENEAYRYTQRSSLRFVALRDRRMDLLLTLDDDSDMAESLEEDEEGEYDVQVRLEIEAHELGD